MSEDVCAPAGVRWPPSSVVLSDWFLSHAYLCIRGVLAALCGPEGAFGGALPVGALREVWAGGIVRPERGWACLGPLCHRRAPAGLLLIGWLSKSDTSWKASDGSSTSTEPTAAACPLALSRSHLRPSAPVREVLAPRGQDRHLWSDRLLRPIANDAMRTRVSGGSARTSSCGAPL